MSTSPTLSFPSPASSTAETSLPTPDQPYEPYSRRSSLASLDMGMNMSPPPLPDYTPKRPIRHEVYETPTTQSRLDASMGPGALSGSPGQVPPPSQPGSNNSSAFMQNLSQRRSATNPTPTYRAAPPPPILLRRPTDINASVVVEDIALRTGSSTSSGRRTPISPGGLNISGVPGLSEPLDREEESDLLPELAPSPHRAFFGGSSSAGAPASPAWQSFETNPNAPSSNGSPTASGPHRVRQSLDVPYSPLGPRTREHRFEPTPNHGLHSRNLSLYFPQPGESSTRSSQGALITSPEEIQDGVLEGQQGVANAGKEKTPFGGTSNWSFGGKASAQAAGLAGLVTPDASKKSKRRGHHHKHSLSHNFFSFLDPTQTNPNLSNGAASPVLSAPRPVDTPQPVPMPLLSNPSLVTSSSSQSLSPLPPSRLDWQQQMLLSFSALEFLVGAGLWVEGQMSGWRCLAGVGYLVVFDAIGVAVKLAGEQGWRSVRRPYGGARLLALLCFVQSLFLVFSAVYIAKESIEQVLLGSAAHDHGGGGGHHALTEAIGEGDERAFPIFLLMAATITSVYSGYVLENHSKLVEAVGTLFLPGAYVSNPVVQRFRTLLANPFSVTIAGSCSAVVIGSMIVPPSSLHSFDSSLSLLLTVLASALAYPPTLSFGHALLQTAPSPSSGQMKSLRKTLKDINDEPRVLGVGTVRCWTISSALPKESRPALLSDMRNRISSSSVYNKPSMTPDPYSSPDYTPNASPTRPSFDRNGTNPASYPSKSSTKGGAPLVVSLNVHVHPDSSDRDVLDITKLTWSKVSNAVNAGSMGLEGRGGLSEISVAVKRGWDGAEEDK